MIPLFYSTCLVLTMAGLVNCAAPVALVQTVTWNTAASTTMGYLPAGTYVQEVFQNAQNASITGEID